MNLKHIWLLGILVGACTRENSCGLFYGSSTYDYNDGCINPKRPDYEQPICAELRRDDACWNPARPLYDGEFCEDYRKDPSLTIDLYMGGLPDAGTSDADKSDAGPDASSVRMGRCGPNAPDNYSDPESVWFGPLGEAPTNCPETTESVGTLSYSDLDETPLDDCALCGCEPIPGTCSLPANTIHFRDGLCGGDVNLMTNFGPLENWDGSCSSDHAIVASAECPLGSGIPCVQSFYAWALPEPNPACETIEIPLLNAITGVPMWKNQASPCASTSVGPSSALRSQFPEPKRDEYEICIPGGAAGDGWRTCVHPTTTGVKECDTNSLFSVKIVTYEESGYVDARHCSACGCEASGGTCVGTLNVYEDNECQSMLAIEALDSNGPTCDDLLPPGKAIGSKALKDLHAVPGTCKATGGTVQGDVIEDEAKAVIWCCLIEESALYNIDL